MPMPTNIVTMRIDRGTGKLTKRTDRTSMFEYFALGSEPQVQVPENEIVDPFDGNDSGVVQENDIF